MAKFNNLLVRVAGSPKNTGMACMFANSDVVTTSDALYHRSTTRTPIIVQEETPFSKVQVVILQRESSTPKNMVGMVMFSDGMSQISMIESPAQESDFMGLAHMQCDARGNSKSDQKKRGGISG